MVRIREFGHSSLCLNPISNNSILSRKRSHVNAAKYSVPVPFSHLRDEMSSMVPSLLDITALYPIPNVILTCLDPNSDQMIVTGLVNDCRAISGKIQIEAESRSALNVQMSHLRRSCQDIEVDIGAVTKATKVRQVDDNLFCENVEKFKIQREEVDNLEVEKDRLQELHDSLEDEIDRLKEQDRQIQKSESPNQREIYQLDDEHRAANKELEKKLSHLERGLEYDEVRLQRFVMSTLRPKMKEREDLVVSTYTHEDLAALTTRNVFYNRLGYFLVCVALVVLAIFIHVFVNRLGAALFN